MASERATNLAEAIRYDISSRGEFDRGAVAAIIDAELANVRTALKKIRGEVLPPPDDDDLIVDATCVYCDQNSADGCDEDCPRTLAADALASLEVRP